MATLNPGDAAPDFSLPRDGGGTVSLSDYRGRKLVLFFYPKDDTSGCTAEAVDFTALKPQFDALGAVLIGLSERFREQGADILGVSPDSVASHDAFRDKHGLTVALASDESTQMLQAYGVWVEKSMYGRNYMGVERTTFLIGPDGVIQRVWPKVSVPGHAEEVLEAVAGGQ
jgi:peroxiredoxin Q/BCP